MLLQSLWEAILERGHPFQFQPGDSFDYEMRIVRAHSALSTTYEEVEHALNLLERFRSFQEIRALLKLYVISWIALSDVVGTLINEVFDLGYAEKDVSLTAVLANRKVRDTALPAIIRKHSASLRYSYFSKIRNDVVHRGWLDDPEYDQLHGEWLTAVLRRALQRGLDVAITEAAEETNIHQRMRDLANSKRESLSSHLKETAVLLEEVGELLAAEVRSRE